jgi:hypothetical protein
MPVTFDTAAFSAWSTSFREGAWLRNTLNEAMATVQGEMKVPHYTGKMEAALANITPATGIGLMVEGGIGNMAMVGEPEAKAPPDTISNFLKWYNHA